jgi:1-aminocyclopropane-1-carboxylate deaminase/D-cysteine desulfhydrase-like pyridoxal-dependent ACC family enzyme
MPPMLLPAGILTDPVYTAKLFLEAERICLVQEISGNTLIVHSGGGTGLFGYQVSYAQQRSLPDCC